jgi:hypothetical protein
MHTYLHKHTHTYSVHQQQLGLQQYLQLIDTYIHTYIHKHIHTHTVCINLNDSAYNNTYNSSIPPPFGVPTHGAETIFPISNAADMNSNSSTNRNGSNSSAHHVQDPPGPDCLYISDVVGFACVCVCMCVCLCTCVCVCAVCLSHTFLNIYL